MDSNKITEHLKNAISSNLEKAFEEIGKYLDNESILWNDFIFFKGKYNAIYSNYVKNLISHQDYVSECDIVRMGMISLVSKMSPIDVSKQNGGLLNGCKPVLVELLLMEIMILLTPTNKNGCCPVLRVF